jgi:hypothetical protein
MRRFVGVILVFLVLPAVTAAEKLRDYSWSELKASGQAKPGEVVTAGPDGAEECLLVAVTESGSARAELFAVDQPGIREAVYALKTRVRYEDVEGAAFLEMWSHFPDRSAYFSRTLADQGPMACLRGTSGWRDVILPFSAAGTPMRPSRLVINLVMPGKGKVWIGTPALVQYREGEDPLALSGSWWSDHEAGWAGAIAGSTLGLVGALVGALGSLGRARSLVLGLMTAVSIAGAIAAGTGVFAWMRGQPYGVYYPLLLGGGIALLVFGGLIPMARRRYAEIELRRITAKDVAGVGPTKAL